MPDIRLTSALTGALLCLSLIFTGSAVADTVQLKADHPERYVVVKGDTLWDISSKFLEDPWRWPEIWHINPEIKNPHLIYPGDIILLVYVDGKPTLKVQRGRQTVKLSPQARIQPATNAIPTINADVISDFLVNSRVLTKIEIEQAGYVAASENHRMLSSAGSQVFVRGLMDDANKSFALYRINKHPYLNPEDPEDILGYEATLTADTQMTRSGDPATLKVIKAYREVLIGDKAFPVDDEELNQNFNPHAPDKNMKGEVIAILDNASMAGTYQSVVINLGEREGAELGHIFASYIPGAELLDRQAELRKDYWMTLPDERAALMMVYRVFDRVSYALILNSTNEIEVGAPIAAP